MNLHVIDTGFFKLDGGAMFGVLPKSLWNRMNPADENNMCNWAMRCLLVEQGDRLILIDTGIGDKQSEKFFNYYFLSGNTSLEDALKKKGFSTNDVTDVLLTHLHFDHCGGAVKWNKDRTAYECTFPNAKYHTHEKHWNHALNPNAREKASFLKENLLPIQESGQLNFVEEGFFAPGIELLVANGHTEMMFLPKLEYKGKHLVYMADMVPSAHHVPVNYVMAYDIRPLNTMTEKEIFYNEALSKDYILMFEHDPVNECGSIQMTERGVKLKETFELSEIG